MAKLLNFEKNSNGNQKLLRDIVLALQSVKGWGSVEIFIQNHKVTQITERNIIKTEHTLENGSSK